MNRGQQSLILAVTVVLELPIFLTIFSVRSLRHSCTRPVRLHWWRGAQWGIRSPSGVHLRIQRKTLSVLLVLEMLLSLSAGCPATCAFPGMRWPTGLLAATSKNKGVEVTHLPDTYYQHQLHSSIKEKNGDKNEIAKYTASSNWSSQYLKNGLMPDTGGAFTKLFCAGVREDILTSRTPLCYAEKTHQNVKSVNIWPSLIYWLHA